MGSDPNERKVWHMGTILDQLADYARVRVAKKKEEKPLEEIREEALARTRAERLRCKHGTTPGSMVSSVSPGPDLINSSLENFNRELMGSDPINSKAKPFRFERALAEPGDIRFICECKKASPSKGLIAPDFPYREIAKQYEAAGASAISVLTEPKWFLGSDDYLREIAAEVQTPCLRKDFTVDPYVIYEAKLLGASAVLLICALLDTKTLASYIEIADSLGLSALVEAHDEAELASAVAAGARIIGVNNRNLKDFTVDIHNSIRLREHAPAGTIFVAESGIRTPEDVEILRRNGVNAVLIGEQLMRATSPKAEINRLRGRERRESRPATRAE